MLLLPGAIYFAILNGLHKTKYWRPGKNLSYCFVSSGIGRAKIK